jgi:hypothetical protein
MVGALDRLGTAGDALVEGAKCLISEPVVVLDQIDAAQREPVCQFRQRCCRQAHGLQRRAQQGSVMHVKQFAQTVEPEAWAAVLRAAASPAG